MLSFITMLLTIPVDITLQTILEEICMKRPDFENKTSLDFWFGSSTNNNEMDDEKVVTSPLEDYLQKLEQNQNNLENNNEFDNHYNNMKHLEFIATHAYHDQLILEEELIIILNRTKQFLLKTYEHSYMQWKHQSFDIQVNHDRLNAIMMKLGINSDGSFIPLTWYQKLLYSTPYNRLLTKLKSSKKQALRIAKHIMSLEENQCDQKDVLLMQYFVLEQCKLTSIKEQVICRKFFSLCCFVSIILLICIDYNYTLNIFFDSTNFSKILCSTRIFSISLYYTRIY